jgi:hypothetical protein
VENHSEETKITQIPFDVVRRMEMTIKNAEMQIFL